MGFQGGNGGSNTGTPTQASIRIPQARLEIIKDDNAASKFPTLYLRVFYDDLGNNTWLTLNPKVFLFRYKKRMKKSRSSTHRPNPTTGHEIAPAGFTHTENGLDANIGIYKVTEWNANLSLPVQGNSTNRPFYKKHATEIALKFEDWFRKTNNDKFCPRGRATNNIRFSEYFKFCYCIEKDGKILFGDLSTETIKMRTENLRDNTGQKFIVPIIKLV